MLDPKDGGYKSRKMVMAYVAMVFISSGFLAVGRWTSLGPFFEPFIFGILGSASLYTGGNVFVKWAQSKQKPKAKKPPEQPPQG